VGLLAFLFLLDIGQKIIVPLVFALILAILLNPVVNYLYNRNINRVISILIASLLAFILAAGLIIFISYLVMKFSESFPEFKGKFNVLLTDAIQWVSHTFNIREAKINAWIEDTKMEGINNSSVLIGKTLSTISGILITIFLLPVYIFMILFYKPLLLGFISKLFAREKHQDVAEVLAQTKMLIQSYLVGLLVEVGIVAVLNSFGLLMLGIDYAILLGIIGALLNIIPYIGGLIAISLPILVAFATKTPTDALFVFILYVSIQFIDNNYIVPKIVASRVKINALVSLVAVLIGSAVWGVPGMFLSIPLTAIMKVIFDRIPRLESFGFLLGDNLPPFGKEIFKFKRTAAKKK
jgi:predicted PurR-regulated permease PerM